MNRSVPHHRKLPPRSELAPHWTLIAGRAPPDGFGYKSEKLQIIYNHADKPWSDAAPHAHAASEEVYVVLQGVMTVEVDGTTVDVAKGEVLCVPAGIVHRLVRVTVPHESFVIRAPSVDDKVVHEAGATAP